MTRARIALVRGTALAVAVGAWLGTATVVTVDATPQASPVAVTASAPTFSTDVAPILYQKCVTCHRPGEVAPMSLITYRDVRPWAASIKDKVTTRVMPPWHADRQYGTFRNNLSLTQPEIDTIVQWVAAGAREGDPSAMPAVPRSARAARRSRPSRPFELTT